jgi:2-amino-4-hydroxy-6-hydroxymethyldihydropteridine diphosphokinase
MKEKHQAVIMLGGNIGDTICIFESAQRRLTEAGCSITATSSYYRSKPWGFAEQRNFLNRLLVVETDNDVEGFHEICKTIEKQHGKSKLLNNGPRSLDIDLLFFDDLVWDTSTLVIPHPRLHLRKFNLVPMLEIIPDWIHPIIKKRVSDILASCEDTTVPQKLII